MVEVVGGGTFISNCRCNFVYRMVSVAGPVKST